MDEQYTLDYAPNVIELLGIGLYKQLPQAIEELITNSWDADATKVKIFMDYKNREIHVIDNGIGMSHDELNLDFLTVANNRRITKGTDFSPKGRPVTGKKGVGKLSLFGVANIIQVTSKKNGRINSFEMNYKQIQSMPSNEKYHPKSLISEKKIDLNDHGTEISLKDISLKNITPLDLLWNSLARRFNKYSKDEFFVTLTDSNGNQRFLDEKTFFLSIRPNNLQFQYKFPEDFKEEIKENDDLKKLNNFNINGIVYTSKKPLKAKDTGFAILARGKLAGEPIDYQFSDRANDYFYTYSTGFFNMDFIDDDSEKNFISTDRQSVLWDSDEKLMKVRRLMNKLINKISNKWKNDRKKSKQIERNREINDLIKDNEKINMIFNSSNLSYSDIKTINTIKKIMLDPKTKLTKENKEILLNFAAINTEQYQRDNSVYNNLIPQSFNMPEKVGDKIQKIRAEAVSIPCDRTKGEKFIISEGLLFRALIDATSSTLLDKNSEDIEDLQIIQKEIKNKRTKGNIGTTEWICNLSLRSRLKATIQFLDKKGDLPSKKTVKVYYDRLSKDKIIENLDMLMHDNNYYPNFTQVKNMWDVLCPILSKAFKYI